MNIVVIICSIIIPVFSLNEKKPKLCINCKFFKNSFMVDNKFGKCSLFKEDMKNDADYFVTGVQKYSDYTFCSIARTYEDMCGKEGNEYIDKMSK